ncbi:MAG: hypothetical protein H0U23_01670 [Blastocatellia bacterium]|nr:hypothetical protein [Blastocatellia bacterium]
MFGPEYEADGIATLIYEIARGTKMGGTPLVIPHPKDVWYSVLTDAVFTGNVDNLRRSARITKRAILAIITTVRSSRFTIAGSDGSIQRVYS